MWYERNCPYSWQLYYPISTPFSICLVSKTNLTKLMWGNIHHKFNHVSLIYICMLPNITTWQKFVRNVRVPGWCLFHHCGASDWNITTIWWSSMIECTETHGLQRMNPTYSWLHQQVKVFTCSVKYLNIHYRHKVLYGHSPHTSTDCGDFSSSTTMRSPQLCNRLPWNLLHTSMFS